MERICGLTKKSVRKGIMNFKMVRYQDVPSELWDRWVFKIKESTYLHSSKFLNFLHSMIEPESRLTFALIENEDRPVALCPFGVSKNKIGGVEFVEASWKGAPLGAAAQRAEIKPSLRMKTQRAVHDCYSGLLKERGAKRCCLRLHPVSLDLLEGTKTAALSQFSLLQEGYEPHPQNTLVIDLKNDEETLLLYVSRYQKKHIKKSVKDGLRFIEYTQSSIGLEEMFSEYQKAHFKSAGRLTRPQESFDLMLKFIKEGAARLFVVFAEETPISFLYCGEFHGFAFGWSQANVDEFEKRHSPRHLLEWGAIMSYKKRGFAFYELGTIWYTPQLYKMPTPKEFSKSEFKRRYGGVLMPDLEFEKVFDKDLWVSLHQHRMEQFLQSGYFEEGVGACEDEN